MLTGLREAKVVHLALPFRILNKDERETINVDCIVGTFATGLNGMIGRDTGTGFEVKGVEDNLVPVFVDVYFTFAVSSGVRSQVAEAVNFREGNFYSTDDTHDILVEVGWLSYMQPCEDVRTREWAHA